MFDASKRKNDDKAKGLPRRRVALMIVLFTLIIGTIVGVALRFVYYPATGLSGHLFYSSGSNSYDLNMSTGERISIEPLTRPLMPAQIWEPTSPDGKWRAEWIDGMQSTAGQPSYSTIRLTSSDHSQVFDILPPDLFTEGSKIMGWSPDSQSIVFIANRNDMPGASSAEMWRLNVVSKQLERLTVNSFAEVWPSFSPDGTKIGYVAYSDGYRRLFVMDVATGTTQLLTPDMFVYFPVWSPDSQWLAIMTDHVDRTGDIWIVRADGSEQRPIAITAESEREPVWLP